jgi:hypothetical protein
VLAPIYASLPVLLYIENAAFWVICKFDKPDGSARSLGPSSIPSLSDGDMLERGVDRLREPTRGLHSRFHVPSVQHGSAAMPVPSATGDQASALAP